MKPFDLEAAKRGEPIITRDGRAAKFIAHVPEAAEGSRVLVLINSGIPHHHENGSYFQEFGHPMDLFMAPKRRTVWVNLYPGTRDACWHESEDAANENASDDRIGSKAHPIEIEE